MLDFSRWPHKLGPPFKWDSQKGIQMRRIVKFCPPGNPLWQILTWNRLILWVTDIGVQKDHLQQTIRKTSIEQQSKLAVLYWKWMNICKVYVFFQFKWHKCKNWMNRCICRSQPSVYDKTCAELDAAGGQTRNLAGGKNFFTFGSSLWSSSSFTTLLSPY